MNIKYRLGKGAYRNLYEGYEKEWIEGNGIGGFSNLSVSGNLSRIHAGYLVASLNPPVDRINILAKTNELIEIDNEIFDLSCQMYKNSTKNDEGFHYLEAFEFNGVAKYIYRVNDFVIEKSISLDYGKNTVAICYDVTAGNKDAFINITPCFSCRENCTTYDDNVDMKLDSSVKDGIIRVSNQSDDRYIVKLWCNDGRILSNKEKNINNLFYAIDSRNGYEGSDRVYTPVDIQVSVDAKSKKSFYIICTIEDNVDKDGYAIMKDYLERLDDVVSLAPVHDEFIDKLSLSADAFIVNRKSTGLKTILAGFPWFTDWGRDTMIALTGLTLCTGRYSDNEEILESFSKYLKNGLIPNMFPSRDDEEPIYNTVDASLWYFYAVDRYLSYTGKEENYDFIKEKIYPCLKEIVKHYKSGTSFSIKMDKDGLIMAGSDLDQVTWMDVRVGEWVVTPRHGKPVEINALWYNALKVMAKLSKKYGDTDEYSELAYKVEESFNKRFWNEEKQCLFDVVDVNDDKVRPNQIWAVSLPYTMINMEKSKKIVDKVYEELYTCYGLRSLSYKDEEYIGDYIGPLPKRDAAYHMGTVWAFPIGGFITAYCKVNKYSKESVDAARKMCEVFSDHMNDGCLGGIAEVFDGTNTCSGNGCYNQAWSVGEVLRAYMEDVIGNGKSGSIKE